MGKLMEHLSLTQAASHSSQMHPLALSLHMGIVLLALVPLLDFHNPQNQHWLVWWCGSNQIPWIDGICGDCTGAGETMALIYIGSQVKGRASHQICRITTTNLPTVIRCGLL